MQRLTRVWRHQRHDKASNAHNFAFDTLTRVYRDTVYATQSRYRTNPLHALASDALQREWASNFGSNDNDKDKATSSVTNHVGNLGVMSARAAELRALDAAAAAAAGASAHDHNDNNDHRHSHSHSHDHSHSHSHSHSHGQLHDMQTTLHTHAAASPTTTTMTRAMAHERRLHSGVQVEILSLYRAMLREVARMRDADTRVHLRAYIRGEFDAQVHLPRRAIAQIEWRLAYAKRKLEELRGMRDDTRFSLHK